MPKAIKDFPSHTHRVVFFRDLVNNKGERYRVSIDNIEIAHARSPERALEAAQRRFARRHHVPSWKHFADGYEEHEERHPWGSNPFTRERV